VKSFDAAKIIQSAFKNTLTASDLQTQAREQKLDIAPPPVTSYRSPRSHRQPEDIIERMKRLLEK